MGRDKRNEKRTEHYTKLVRNVMQLPAWRALSPVAQALYPWLKFEWRGVNANNNGQIRLSVRQAAEKIGVSRNTAAKAFHQLQAKGFIVVKEHAVLGSSGDACGHAYEITELAMPHTQQSTGRRLYKEWREGHDYPVVRASTNNPSGRNGKTKSRHCNEDRNVINFMTNYQSASSK